MISKKLLFLGMTVFVFTPLRADEVILKEGKTLHGRITHEDEHEVTVSFGKQIGVTVEKSKVKEVIYDKKPVAPPAGKIVTMPGIAAASQKKGMVPSSATKSGVPPGVSSATVKPAFEIVTGLNNISLETTSRSNKKGVVQFIETTVTEPTKLQAKTYQNVVMEIQKTRKQNVSDTKLMSSWTGKEGQENGQARWNEITIVSTMTKQIPYWSNESASPEDVKQWNSLIDQVKKIEEGRAQVYSRGLAALGESLTALRARDAKQLQVQSNKIYKSALQQINKQQSGYNRRHFIKFKPPTP